MQTSSVLINSTQGTSVAILSGPHGQGTLTGPQTNGCCCFLVHFGWVSLDFVFTPNQWLVLFAFILVGASWTLSSPQTNGWFCLDSFWLGLPGHWLQPQTNGCFLRVYFGWGPLDSRWPLDIVHPVHLLATSMAQGAFQLSIRKKPLRTKPLEIKTP